MQITSIEKQVGMLTLTDGLVEALHRARRAGTDSGHLVGGVDLTDLKGLEEAHSLDADRVAALLADPLEAASKS